MNNMESPDDRPVSPKKKFRPSSSNSETFVLSDSSNSADSDASSDSTIPHVNGLAPTRSGRFLSSVSSGTASNTQEEYLRQNTSQSSPQRENVPQNNSQNNPSSIQEEVVSSSENSVCSKQASVSYSEDDPDSVTNADKDEFSLSKEATEKKN